MLDAKVADAAGPDFAIGNGVLHGAPAFQSLRFAAVRAVQEEEIDVAQPAGFHGLCDGSAGGVVRGVRGQFRGEPDVLAGQGVFVGWAFQKVQDGFTDFLLVTIHLGGIEGAVARFQGPFDCVDGFGAGCQVHVQMDVGHA